MENGSKQEPPVEVSGLNHFYGDRQALNDLSIFVNPAEIFGLLGPNGGGKTTLFRILSTYIIPTSGHARIFGQDVVLNPAAARQSMGVVFQSPSLDKMLSAEENLLHQGHLYGISGQRLQQRVRFALQSVGLEGRGRDRVLGFSGGMQRRVEIAKALLHEPLLLLLDEPSTGLDPGARREVWEQLYRLKKNGVACLMTTHLMDEAEKCDRLAIINHGRIVAVGSPDELKAVVGGDVITLESDRPNELCEEINRAFSADASLVGEVVRLEAAKAGTLPAPQLLVELVEAFPGRINSAKLGKPTLEDVFVHYTGSGFHDSESK